MAKIKKDDGIATVKTTMSDGRPVEFPISEELRDSLKKHDFHEPRNLNKLTEPKYQEMTTSELENIRYSGFRTNDFTARLELWVLGQIRGWRSYNEIAANPAAVASLHEEVFKTIGTVVTTDVNIPNRRKMN